MKQLIQCLIFLLTFIFVISCDETATDDDDKKEIDLTKADSLASSAWDGMTTTLETDGFDNLTATSMNISKSDFETVLQSVPDHPQANLGLSLIKLMNIKFSNGVENYVDRFDNFVNQESQQQAAIHPKLITDILQNPYGVFPTSVKKTALSLKNTLQNDAPMTFSEGQALIDQHVLPVLTNAINLLNNINMDSIHITITADGDTYIIDAAEVYLFKAGLNVALAGLEMITLFDIDVLDENNGLDWFNDLDNIQTPQYTYSSQTIDTTKHLYINNYDDKKHAQRDSVSFHYVRENLLNRPAFLKARAGKENGGKVIAALQQVISNIKAADHFVRNIRSSETSQNILKLSQLTDLDNEISPSQDGPAFAANWNSLQDVINFIEKMLTQTVDFSEEINGVTKNFSVNLSSFFTNLTDIRNLLPRHRWKDKSLWVSEEIYYSNKYAFSGNFMLWWNGMTIMDVDSVHETFYDNDVEPVEFLDLSDNVIDHNSTTPYFNDYTFGGLFPGMTRQKFIELFD